MKILSYVIFSSLLITSACTHGQMKSCCAKKEAAACCKEQCTKEDANCSKKSCPMKEAKVDCAASKCDKKS
jgi:hypothetical protein